MPYTFTESLELQLLDKIDEEVTNFYDPIIEPVGNDDGAIRNAIKFLLTCTDKDLIANRFALQKAYVAYFKLNDEIGDYKAEDMLADFNATEARAINYAAGL